MSQLSHIQHVILLQHLPETGAAVYWRLLDRFPSIRTALDAPMEKLSALLSPAACEALMQHRAEGDQSRLLRKVNDDIAWAELHNIHLIDMDDNRYPALLREIKKPPPLLYVWGNPSTLSLPQIAVVGSRSPTPGGVDNAEQFCADLAANGVTITSGLALGIDVAAHKGAIKAGGRTIAVLGTGIDKMYPARHDKVAIDIVHSGGAVVSEFPIGTSPQAGNFPQRNRIISGLSCGVLVVEAAVKSGSLITAKYALQQDREVFAIPGSIHNPLSRGGHSLIKQGAKLVETAQDIVDEIGGFLSLKQQEMSFMPTDNTASLREEILSSDHEGTILNSLGYDTVDLDTLVVRTGLPTGELIATLLSMELKGLVGNVGHGYTRTHKITGRNRVSG